ncbi:MAG: 2-C-methyl-D-erythritol 4-phosphate cytidylyltransferase [Acidobacteriota bacterium]
MNIAIIPAGGQGRRMGGVYPTTKQFLPLQGIPLIIHTLRQFENCPEIDAVIVVLPTAQIQEGDFLQLIHHYNLTKVLPPIAGAIERQGSVFAGLQAIEANASLRDRVEIVAIHDAVRPFITPTQITATIVMARKTGAAICALPATDTIKEVLEEKIQRTLPRDHIYLAQTPQTFRYQLIFAAHSAAARENFLATDDAMLVERLGGSIAVVTGSPDNIKITNPSDLALAESILSRRQNNIEDSL